MSEDQLGRERLTQRWIAVQKLMRLTRLSWLVVAGRGALGSYGPVAFLSGRVPDPKGEMVLIGADGPPVFVVGSAAEARWRADLGPRNAVVSPTGPGGVVGEVARLIRRRAVERIGRIAVVTGDGRGLSYCDHDYLQTELGVELHWLGDKFAALMRSKTDADIRAMTDAVRLAETAVDQLSDEIRPGMSELDAAAILTSTVVAGGGALTLALVSGGMYLGQPPSRRLIQQGELVTVAVEFAARDGSWVELGALLAIGQLTDTHRGLARDLIATIHIAEEALVPGRSYDEVARSILDVTASRGWVPVEGLGHGIGIDEERPGLHLGESLQVECGTIMAVHPSLADMERQLSAGLANTVVVEASGPRPLSAYPHEVRSLV